MAGMAQQPLDESRVCECYAAVGGKGMLNGHLDMLVEPVEGKEEPKNTRAASADSGNQELDICARLFLKQILFESELDITIPVEGLQRFRIVPDNPFKES